MLRRTRIATDARLALFDRDVLLAHAETRDLANELLVDLDRLSGTPDQFDTLRVACGEVLGRVGCNAGGPTAEGRALQHLIELLSVDHRDDDA